MNPLAVTWADFVGTDANPGFVDVITNNFTTINLIGILAGVVGVTTAFVLIWRLAAYIRRQILTAMTNSRARRGW